MFDIDEFREIKLPSENEILNKFLSDITVPTVSFVCTTYNHEAFIEDTIRGFLLQETSFPYEILIHDDCSTDGTKCIIQKYAVAYPNLIKAYFQKENQYSKNRHFPLHFMFGMAKGKYIAVCEGDDFWIDRYKTSRQLSVLEGSKDIALVYSKAYIYDEPNSRFTGKTVGGLLKREQLYLRNLIPTLTVMFRRQYLEGYENFVKYHEQNWMQSDYPLWLWLNSRGAVIFNNSICSVYRILKASASRAVDVRQQYEFRKSALLVSSFYAEKFLAQEKVKGVLFYHHTFIAFWCFLRKLDYGMLHLDRAKQEACFFQKLFLNCFFSKLFIKFFIPVFSKLRG